MPSEDKRISPTKLKQLMKETVSAQANIDEGRGEIAALIRTAVEKHNLNRKMFGWCRQLDRMEPEKLAYMLEDLEYYIESLGLKARAATAPSFSEAAEEGNVAKFPGKAAE